MNKLYIIGNGFDLAHGLKTSYKDFYDFLSKEKLSSGLDKYIERMQAHDTHLEKFSCESEKKKYFWTEWESSFHTVGIMPYIIGFSGDDSLKIKNDFITYLNKWIIETVNNSLSEYHQKYNFEDNSLFLSFNYSSTLENLYSIDYNNITYIHGKSQNLESNLIFGSSYSLEPVNITNLEREVFKAKYLTPFRHESVKTDLANLKKYSEIPETKQQHPPKLTKAFYKDIASIINQNNLKTKYKDIEEIHIIGHSVGYYQDDMSPGEELLKSLNNYTNIDDGYYEFLLTKLKKLQTVVVYEYQNTAKYKVKKLKQFNSEVKYIVKYD